ncbi:hypothetical protein [Streptomyces luteolus]|uniref:Integral membrane protein n=1 Tax=Streptomyces luteolus TaxID=3043615 RepID=A0ABT6SSX7_9ACTN|nr:hypothetical protein [Streptomyces sp. B-S-A12]MDI3418710.1 hypothetical protein [Streptomyces sp. B-S-A12]
MTRTVFVNLAYVWGQLTLFEGLWIVLLWQTRSRVLGKAVYWIPGARRIRRGACERRVGVLLDELKSRGVPEEETPDKDQLVDRWHRIVLGRCVSQPLLAAPFLLVMLSFSWSMVLAGSDVMPLWMVAGIGGFGAVSIALLAADERAVAVSDPAGVVTVEAIHCLETLLVPARRRSQDSALHAHGRLFGRLRNALRVQARHGPRTMSAGARQRAHGTTERLIAVLGDADRRYLFSEGAERDTAERDLSRLIASILAHSCPPRAQRTSLLMVDLALLPDTAESDAADSAPEPFRNWLLAGAGKLAVAVSLLAGAALFPGGGPPSALLAAAGLAGVALVYAPLRDALQRARPLLVGGPPAEHGGAEAAAEEPQTPPARPVHCSHCFDHSPVTAGSRPVA